MESHVQRLHPIISWFTYMLYSGKPRLYALQIRVYEKQSMRFNCISFREYLNHSFQLNKDLFRPNIYRYNIRVFVCCIFFLFLKHNFNFSFID